MSNSERLAWNRKNVLKMTQAEFADKAGLCVATIGRLEQDESHWEVIQASTFDKIAAMFEGEKVWPLINRNGDEVKPVQTMVILPKKEEVERTPEWAQELVKGLDNMKTEQDNKTMVLLEFAFTELKDSVTHDEFEENLKLIRKILDKH